MPIAPFLGKQRFDAETVRLMGVAFEAARVVIVRDWDDRADAMVAKRIIELAKAGERDPDQLCEKALKILGTNRPLWRGT